MERAEKKSCLRCGVAAVKNYKEKGHTLFMWWRVICFCHSVSPQDGWPIVHTTTFKLGLQTQMQRKFYFEKLKWNPNPVLTPHPETLTQVLNSMMKPMPQICFKLSFETINWLKTLIWNPNYDLKTRSETVTFVWNPRAGLKPELGTIAIVCNLFPG